MDSWSKQDIEALMRLDPAEVPVVSTAAVQELIRKQAGQFRNESKEQFLEFFERVGSGILLADPETKQFESANRIACNMLGYSEAQLLGLGLADILPAEARPVALDAFGKLASGTLERLEKNISLRRSDGSALSVDIKSFPMRLDTKRYLVARLQQVTDLKRREPAPGKPLPALTHSQDYPDGVVFDDLFDLETLQRIQDTFSAATGVASIITRPDGSPITKPSNFTTLCMDIFRSTEKGCANCYKSDAAIGRNNPEGPIVQPCLSGGLWDAGASIEVGGRHIANWLIGQVRDETQTEERMRDYAREIGADEAAVVEAFRRVPVMSRAHFEEIAQALFTLANQLSTSAYQNMQQTRFIAGQQQAEQSLRESEERFRTIFDQVPDGILVADPKTRKFRMASQAFCTMMGYSEEQVLEMGSEGIHPAEDLPYVIDAFERQARGETDEVYDIPFLRRGGEIFYADMKAFHILLDGQQYLLGHVRDVSTRKRMQDALHESEEKYRKVFESESDAIMIFDEQTRGFVDVNAAAVHLYGYPRAEFLELTQADIIAEPDLAVEPAVVTPESPFGQVLCQRLHQKKDGSVFRVEVAQSTFLWQGRQVTCEVIRDVTERVIREEELIQNRKELRRLASELSLAEQRGREQIAAELHDSMGQLLSSANLRLNVLKESPLPKAAAETLETVCDIVEQSLQQTRSLTFELCCPMLSEQGLAAALEVLCENMSRVKSIDFTFQGDADSLPLPLDRQVVFYRFARELVINVMKHSGADQARVTLERSMDHLRIVVEDNGNGFDASTAGRGFSPTGGYGLFSIHEYLQHAGGQLQIESAPGAGTKVVLDIVL